jgi:methylenetetrahydrofolate reductase (NADPH)
MPIREAVVTINRSDVRSFLSDWSIEIVPTEGLAIDSSLRGARGGTPIYVTAIPGHDTRNVIDASVRLRKANFEPIPHISARGLIDHKQLNDLLVRLRGEADVDSALLLGGDIDDVVGDFASSRAMLETGLFTRHGFRKVGFATYPEPHPRISQAVLERELVSKLRLSAEQGLESWLVSQLCFAPNIIVRHAAHLRANGISAPVHVGFAGPTSWKGMAKFAAICGVSNSARSLSKQVSRVGRLLAGFEPSEIISCVAATATAQPDLGLVKPHFFTFGGAERTVKWINTFSARHHRRDVIEME